jgi:hypothetical protein
MNLTQQEITNERDWIRRKVNELSKEIGQEWREGRGANAERLRSISRGLGEVDRIFAGLFDEVTEYGTDGVQFRVHRLSDKTREYIANAEAKRAKAEAALQDVTAHVVDFEYHSVDELTPEQLERMTKNAKTFKRPVLGTYEYRPAETITVGVDKAESFEAAVQEFRDRYPGQDVEYVSGWTSGVGRLKGATVGVNLPQDLDGNDLRGLPEFAKRWIKRDLADKGIEWANVMRVVYDNHGDLMIVEELHRLGISA